MGNFTGIGKLPSELEETTAPAEDDIVITGNGKRTTWKNIFEKISCSGLSTTAKNIVGAINELFTSVSALNTNIFSLPNVRYVYVGEGTITVTLKKAPPSLTVGMILSTQGMYHFKISASGTISSTDTNLTITKVSDLVYTIKFPTDWYAWCMVILGNRFNLDIWDY